jgi:Mg2+/Co2+ transporter CorB
MLAIAVLLVLSALLSGSETAMTAASRERIWHLAGEGDRRAKLVQRLAQHKERLIGALLIGNNIVNISAAALATELFIRLVGEAGVAVATLVMTVLVVVFGEVLPKTYAIRHAEVMAMRMAPALRLLVLVLSPITTVLRVVVDRALRLFGSHLEGGGLVPVTERLRGTIALAAAEGRMKKPHKDMLGAVLDLEEIEVGMVMKHRTDMATIDADSPIEDAVRFVSTQPYTRYPVWQGDPDTIVGVLHAKDLLAAYLEAGADAARLKLIELAAPPWFVPDTTSLLVQLQAFRQRRAHLALVVDEYGTLQGLVTLEDIIEEIVGDIRDEKDVEVSGVRTGPDGSVLVEGHVTVRDLNRQFDWSLPDEEVATVAGLVIQEAGRIPEVGERFELRGFRFEVLRRHRHQLTLLKVSRLPAEA